MAAFVVLDASDNAELGRASFYGSLVASGLAAEMIGGRVHAGESEREAFDFYAGGWSNGYVATAPRADGDMAPTHPAPVTAHLKGRHNQDSHGNDGLGGALDKLKLASRIQLGEGESLVSSRKFKSSDSNSWDLLAASVDTPNGREVRLGVIRPDHSKQWSAGNSDKTYERIDELDAQLADMDDGDDQFDALSAEREALASQVGEGDSHSKTATLDAAAVAKLRSDIEEAVDRAADWAYEWDQFWENNTSDPDNIRGSPDATLAQGSIPAAGGDSLEWEVVGDGESEPASWRLHIGVRDYLAEDDWYIGRDDDASVFPEGDIEALLDGLDGLAGDQTKAVTGRGRVSAAGKDVTPGDDDQLREYWTKGEGLAKWANSAHPWTTLVRHLTKHVGRERAERIASQWFHLVFGLWPGERKGKNPAGPG